MSNPTFILLFHICRIFLFIALRIFTFSENFIHENILHVTRGSSIYSIIENLIILCRILSSSPASRTYRFQYWLQLWQQFCWTSRVHVKLRWLYWKRRIYNVHQSGCHRIRERMLVSDHCASTFHRIRVGILFHRLVSQSSSNQKVILRMVSIINNLFYLFFFETRKKGGRKPRRVDNNSPENR